MPTDGAAGHRWSREASGTRAEEPLRGGRAPRPHRNRTRNPRRVPDRVAPAAPAAGRRAGGLAERRPAPVAPSRNAAPRTAVRDSADRCATVHRSHGGTGALDETVR
ncbi:hypothetical protein GCM10022630_40530 [Thermobifida alba]